MEAELKSQIQEMPIKLIHDQQKHLRYILPEELGHIFRLKFVALTLISDANTLLLTK